MAKDGLEGLSSDLPYDLRQIYAVELLGEHLKDVARARKQDDFPSYFKCLKDVWIVAQQKFKKSKKVTYTILDEEGKGEKVEVGIEKYYQLLMQNVATLANEFKSDWLGQTKNEIKRAKIEDALNNVEMFLYDQIEKANIFGSSKTIPGL